MATANVDYRLLGRTGVQVSRLCLGTMTFGGEADEKVAGEMYARSRERGINFFDTADVYTKGASEAILGRLVAGHRDQVVIASKAHFPTGPGANDRGLSRRHLRLAVEASLRRLGTDRIDLFYAHGFDASTPIDEVVVGLDELVRSGKVVYLGVSNWAAWQIATALGLAARSLCARFQVVQPMYNLAKRQVEVEILPLAAAEGLAVVPYSPLGGGLLSGKYGVEATPARGRLTDNEMYRTRYRDALGSDLPARLAEHAQTRGLHPATVAVAWVLSHPAVTAPIVGARSVEQLEASLAALDVVMEPDWRAEVSAFAPAPPPATDRSEERQGLRYGGGGPPERPR